MLSSAAQGFVVPQSQQHTSMLFKAAKGFGAKEPSVSKKKKAVSPPPTTTSADISTSSEVPNPFTPAPENDLSQGKAALERLRRERAEKRNAELRKVKEVQDVDAMLRESPEAAVIPEKVAQRMGKRLLPFVGVPLIGGMGLFVGFWYMATYQDMEFQPALVAASTIGLLAIGLVGITYSIMSASWDEDREGSFLGTDEFSKNVDNIKEGLSRSRENAFLRDRMNDFTPEEIANVDAKDSMKEKRQKSFSEKFGDELD